MAKILAFKRVQRQAAQTPVPMDKEAGDFEGYVSSVLNDYALTVANRHWILQNMLMDIDDQLDGYKKELEEAEKKLDTLVQSAELEIAAAYSEFNAHVGGMTRAVKKLTMSAPRPKASGPADLEASLPPDHRTTPK